MNFAWDNEMDTAQYIELMKYAEAHLNIAARNAARKVAMARSMQPQVENPANPANPEQPAQPNGVNISENLQVPGSTPGMGAGISGNQASALLKGAA
jgi:hypothetical protein